MSNAGRSAAARAGFTTPLLLTAAMFIISGVLFALLAPETHRTG
jgi:hypothetical protein